MILTTWWLSDLLLLVALLCIYLGFAGFLGSLLFRSRQRLGRQYLGWLLQVLMFAATIVVFLGISLLPPWNTPLLRAQFLIFYTVILVFSLRPIRRPEWIWKTAHAFRYLSLTLVLIVLWALSGEITPAKLMIVPWAGLAAVLAWQRSRVSPEDLQKKRLSAQPAGTASPHLASEDLQTAGEFNPATSKIAGAENSPHGVRRPV
jgi:hypothetical protein